MDDGKWKEMEKKERKEIIACCTNP